MELDTATVERLVDAQVSAISEPSLVALIEKLRVPPRRELRGWSYGPPHAFPCWLILEHRPSNTGIAYCTDGFGPKAPWGLLWLSGARMDMGDDSAWFISLADALRDSQVMLDAQGGHVVLYGRRD